MKKIIIFFLICSVIVLSCHKKAIPEITTRTKFPPTPKLSQLPAADTSLEAISDGKIVYETKCSRCHELKDTKIYTTQRWTSILKTMIPRAEISDEQTKQVITYVMANAKK